MSKLLDFYNKYIARLNKYWLVTVLFFAYTFLIDESNIYNHRKYNEKIRLLENEIEKYKKEIKKNREKIKELQTDKVSLEQFAREEYLMKRSDEDIFIVEEE
jgi:cell division protein FtsB